MWLWRFWDENYFNQEQFLIRFKKFRTFVKNPVHKILKNF